MTFKVITIPTDNLWQTGTIEPGGYDFSAKVYGAPSRFGIEGGPISKLTIRDREGREIINYQRGWAVIPFLKWEIADKPRFFHLKRRAILKAVVTHYRDEILPPVDETEAENALPDNLPPIKF